jgi:hypothetical protein
VVGPAVEVRVDPAMRRRVGAPDLLLMGRCY